MISFASGMLGLAVTTHNYHSFWFLNSYGMLFFSFISCSSHFNSIEIVREEGRTATLLSVQISLCKSANTCPNWPYSDFRRIGWAFCPNRATILMGCGNGLCEQIQTICLCSSSTITKFCWFCVTFRECKDNQIDIKLGREVGVALQFLQTILHAEKSKITETAEIFVCGKKFKSDRMIRMMFTASVLILSVNVMICD